MKKNLIVLLFISISPIVFAYNYQDSIPPDFDWGDTDETPVGTWSHEDSVSIIQSLDSFKNSFLESLDTCYKSSILTSSVVYYQSFCNAEIELSNILDSSLFYSYDELYVNSKVVESETVLLSGLEKDKLYSIMMYDKCGHLDTIGVISTFPRIPLEVIDVPEKVLRALSKSFREEEVGTHITDLLEIIPDSLISTHQKFYITQEFTNTENSFLDNATFPPYDPSNDLPSPTESLKDRCKCVLIRANSNVTPGIKSGNELSGSFTGGEWGPYGRHERKFQWSNNSSYWHNIYNVGPAKWHQSVSEGTRENIDQGRFATWGDQQTRDGNPLTQSARIQLQHFCLDRESIIPPEDPCNCTKRVDLLYSYSSRLRTGAVTRDQGSGSKRSRALLRL